MCKGILTVIQEMVRWIYNKNIIHKGASHFIDRNYQKSNGISNKKGIPKN